MVFPKCSFLHKKSLIKIRIKAKTWEQEINGSLSAVLSQYILCLCCTPRGKGIIVVRVLPAKPVLGRERQKPPGEGMG